MEPPPSRRRTLLVIALTLLSLGLVAVVAGDVLVGRLVDATEARWRKDHTTARERIAGARFPALRGEPLQEDGALLYAAVAASFATRGVPKSSIDADVADPFQSVPSARITLVQTCASDLVALRAASRCDRTAWALALGLEHEELWRLVDLLMTEGHLRAQAGDVTGAAERYLDATRIGADLERGWVSYSIVPSAEALARLVTSGRAADLPFARLEGELDRLEKALPSAEDGFEIHRLLVIEVLLRGARGEDVARELGVEAGPLPQRLTAVHALFTLEGAYLRAGRALAAGDLRSWTHPPSSWNRFADLLRPSPDVYADDANLTATWLAFTRLAIDLERQTPPRDARRVRPRRDPFAPSTWLRVEVAPDGVGYRLTSQGPVTDQLRPPGPVVLERQ